MPLVPNPILLKTRNLAICLCSKKFSFSWLYRYNTFIMQFSSNSVTTGNLDKRDHLTVTSDQQPEPNTFSATVIQITNLSPTVKQLVLETDQKPTEMKFKSGQWVDFFIPGVEKVGGFSITSSPRLLETNSEFHLAIKYSPWPPAHWVHTKCEEGSKVSIRVGGDFFYEAHKFRKVLLIAGGVGINPLASIMNELWETKLETKTNDDLRVSLLYSAKGAEELIFKDSFQKMMDHESFNVKLFVTGKSAQASNLYNHGRITSKDLQDSLSNHLKVKALNPNPIGSETADFDYSDVGIYICGPPGMIQELLVWLAQDLKVPKERIHFEQWWQD